MITPELCRKQKLYLFTKTQFDGKPQHNKIFGCIPRKGKELGPRVHDWRHTWAVNAFRKLSDAGYDLYVALPVISTYLGHKNISATEKYLQLTKQMYPEIDAKATTRFESIMKGVSND